MRTGNRAILLHSGATLVALIALTPSLLGQNPVKVFVEPVEKPDASVVKLREALVQMLAKRKEFELVDSLKQADNLIAVSGETYIKGYLGRNYRLRYVNGESQPVYGGYLSIEWNDRDDQPVWSYLVTPRRFGPEDVNRNLAEQATRKLVDFLSTPAGAPRH